MRGDALIPYRPGLEEHTPHKVPFEQFHLERDAKQKHFVLENARHVAGKILEHTKRRRAASHWLESGWSAV
jgi:hypothetical protein